MKTTLFDRSFVLDAIRNIRRCPKCRREYSVNYDKPSVFSETTRSHRPMLLECGHNICENCVLDNRENLICGSCDKPVAIAEKIQNPAKVNILNYLDLNFFLIGEGRHIQFHTKSGSANHTTSIPNAAVEKIVTLAVKKCEECVTNDAVGICYKCNHRFCKSCFAKIHCSNVFRSHVLHPFSSNRHAGRKQTPDSRICAKHSFTSARYCSDCEIAFCQPCTKNHIRHKIIALREQNENYRDDITVVLESIETATELLRKAMKDVKSVETELVHNGKIYIENVAQYFMKMHSYLQLEQRKAILHMEQMSHATQLKIEDVYSKLRESETTVMRMHATLEEYQYALPSHVLLCDVLKSYNEKLEMLPGKMEITKIQENPFYFEGVPDFREEISKLYKWEYKDPKLNIRLDTIYDCTSYSPPDVSLTDRMDVDESDRMNDAKQQCSMSISSSGNKQPITNQSMVRISHTIGLDCFYIQSDDSMKKIRELSHQFSNLKRDDEVPEEEFVVGQLYFIYRNEDKTWYRAEIKELLPNGMHNVFLVDIGKNMIVDKTSIFTLEKKYLQMPFAARCCALHNILPVNEDNRIIAADLMVEIAQNKPLQLQIFDQSDEVWLVDLIVKHYAWPFSLRSALLYSGLATASNLKFKLQPKTLPPTIPSIRKNKFNVGEEFKVKVIHIENPGNFYVVRSEYFEMRKELVDELNRYYNEYADNHDVVYMAPLKLSCAVCDDGAWYRACVEEIMGEGNVRVRLIDEGQHIIVHWRQIYELIGKFYAKREYAIHCGLADIEPLQKDNYVWTSKAIDEFKRYTSNPKLNMLICNSKNYEYKVTLFINKGITSHNIGALLANQGHGVCTGEAAKYMEISQFDPHNHFEWNAKYNAFKEPQPSTSRAAREALEGSEAIEALEGSEAIEADIADTVCPEKKILGRTEIIIINFINPGEFYIHLSALLESINKFHMQIQQSQNDILENAVSNSSVVEQREWKVGDHCFVFIKYKCPSYGFKNTFVPSMDNSEPALYRGEIVEVTIDEENDCHYDVFLRDFGATVQSIDVSQLFPIDSSWDRVANAAHRCHLACIEPAGGLATWPKTTIDYLLRAGRFFDTLSATLQVKCATKSKSIAIMLWGTLQDTTDPLAPTVAKHSNLNSLIVLAGMGHLVDQFDLTQQTNEFDEIVVAEGEITLEEWEKNIVNKRAFDAIDNGKLSNKSVTEKDVISADIANCLIDVEDYPTTPDTLAPEAWLQTKRIEKSLFTACPTYVSYDGTIYLHHTNDDQLLATMRKKLTINYSAKKLADNLNDMFTYAVGQACVAMYHLDKHFYRGIVQKVHQNNEYDVMFIDYGNVERVKGGEMHPYAPYPQMPSVASKYRLQGCYPMDNLKGNTILILDVMHKMIVEKLVSVRIDASELNKSIKYCTLRVGAIDLTQYLNEHDLVAGQEYSHKREKQTGQLNIIDITDADDEQTEAEKKESVCGLDGISQLVTDLKDLATFPNDDKCNSVIDGIDSENNEVESGNDGNEVDECTRRIIRQLALQSEKDSDVIIEDESIVISENFLDELASGVQPPKKRMMFDRDEYKRFQQEIEQKCYQLNEIDHSASDEILDGRDADVLQLEKSFAADYWHLDIDSGGDEEGAIDNEAGQKKEDENKLKLSNEKRKQKSSNRQTTAEANKAVSEFEYFQPKDSSSVYSYFNGTQQFKQPQLPTGLKVFPCEVASIGTATVLHIVPRLNEYEYRAMELQRTIDQTYRTMPHLTALSPGTMCLARYTKDSKWYRALVRFYNPLTNQLTVLYVDYWNSEVLSLRDVRQMPQSIIGWPLRTFRVRLFGIEQNPDVPKQLIRSKLKQIFSEARMNARIRRQIKNNDNDILEVDLLSIDSPRKLVYQSLIDKGMYRKI